MLTAIVEQARIIAAWLTTPIDLSGKQKKEEQMKDVLGSLKTCAAGMSCDEFSTLVIDGPSRKEMPLSVQKRMELHEGSCSYHISAKFHQSALDSSVTEESRSAALSIIQKYSKLDESKSAEG